MIEISIEDMKKAQKILAGIPKGAERVFSNAINRGLSHTKTQAFKEVKQVYAVKQSQLNGATVTRLQKANTGSLTGYIKFSGVKIPLYQFSVSHSGSGEKVRARLKKGSWTAFDHAFVAQMKNGHIGIFERTGVQGIRDRLGRAKSKRGNKHTEKIEEIMGLSGAQMVGNGEIVEKLTKKAQEKVNERVEHEINRILNGYGE